MMTKVFAIIILVINIQTDILMANNLFIRVNNEIVNSTLTKDGHAKNLEIILNIDGIEFILDLTINSHLIYENYTEKLYSETGYILRNLNLTLDHCFYVGKVRHYSNSAAAISTCSNIHGFFSFNDVSYQISQPAIHSRSWISKYNINRIANDTIRQFCDEFFKNETSAKLEQSIIDSIDEVLVIELYVVNDYDRFIAYDGDASKLFENTMAIVNMASAIFEYVGVRLVIVGSEVFTNRNPFQISSDKTSTLNNFALYRQTVIKEYNDNAYLICGKCFDSGIIGSAFLSTMCSFDKSCGIICEDTKDANHVGKTLAHQIGHNLGLNHDTSDCTCPDTRGCVMNSQNVGSMQFSSCSSRNLATNIENEFKYCLLNQPRTVLGSSSICGNAQVEGQETCDCGNLSPQICNKSCCNSTTCQLIGSAKCAQGGCCNIQTCQFREKGHLCRRLRDQKCDVAEVCTGLVNACPPDYFKSDGSACSNANGFGYCSRGVCGIRNDQCKQLWGEQATDGPIRCYQAANVLGSVSGYCALKYGASPTYEKCDPKDVECGLLHCNINGAVKLKYFTSYVYISYLKINEKICYSVTLNLGSQTRSLSLVQDGTPCGNNLTQMCYQQKCVNISTVPKCQNCPFGWYCSNSEECLCDSTLVNCLTSIQSKTTNVGLIVGLFFFFLILIIIVILLIIFRTKLKCLANSIRNKIDNFRTSKPTLDPISTVSRNDIESSHNMHLRPAPNRPDIQFANQQIYDNRQSKRTTPTINHLYRDESNKISKPPVASNKPKITTLGVKPPIPPNRPAAKY